VKKLPLSTTNCNYHWQSTTAEEAHRSIDNLVYCEI